MCHLPVSKSEIQEAIRETRDRDYSFDMHEEYVASYSIRMRMLRDFELAPINRPDSLIIYEGSMGYIMTHYIGLPEHCNVGECWSEEIFSQLNDEI